MLGGSRQDGSGRVGTQRLQPSVYAGEPHRLWQPVPRMSLRAPPSGGSADGDAPSGGCALCGGAALVGAAGGGAWFLDLDATQLTMGARGSSARGGTRSGAGLQHLRVLENATARAVIVPVHRDAWSPLPEVYRRRGRVPGAALANATTLHVRYATRAGSATGVTSARGASCLALPVAARGGAAGGCGDYVHVAGVLSFPPGVARRDIVVPLMDDGCAEPMEWLEVLLSSPGGLALEGAAYRVRVTLDDDDADKAGGCSGA